MTATELAALIVAIASVAAVALLAVALVSIVKTLHAVRDVVELLRVQAVPMLEELGDTVQAAGGELQRLDGVLDRAESIGTTVDAASRLAYMAVSSPVIKTMAAASGTSRAARRLRRRGGQ